MAVITVTAILAVSVSLGLAVAGQQKSVQDGVFTAGQAESGAEIFDKVCLECHTNDYFGPDYMIFWEGATVGELFEQIQATMPYENPGGLPDGDYADVIAYLMKLNGVKPGGEELADDIGPLREITITGPFEWTGDR